MKIKSRMIEIEREKQEKRRMETSENWMRVLPYLVFLAIFIFVAYRIKK